MWMSDIMVMVNRQNVDHNSLLDIAAAIADTGASVVSVDSELFAIEAAAPSEAIATISAMEGVSYVRCVFSYLCQGRTPAHAA
jgi:hypothetical protein